MPLNFYWYKIKLYLDRSSKSHSLKRAFKISIKERIERLSKPGLPQILSNEEKNFRLTKIKEFSSRKNNSTGTVKENDGDSFKALIIFYLLVAEALISTWI